MKRLVLEQVLQLARVAADPLPPDVERQRRIVGVGPQLAVAQSRHGPLDARGQQVDLAHLGRVAVADLDRRVVGRHPVGAAASRRAVASDGAGRGAECQHDGRLRRQLVARAGELESAGEHRVDDDPVAYRARGGGTCRAARIAVTRWPDEGRELGRRAPHGERRRGRRGSDGRPARAAWNASATIVRSGNSGTAGRL